MDKNIPKKVKLRLFVLNYSIITPDGSYQGVSVVKATTVALAQRTFLSESNFAGYQNDIKISRIEEIFLSPEAALLCEEYVKTGFNN